MNPPTKSRVACWRRRWSSPWPSWSPARRWRSSGATNPDDGRYLQRWRQRRRRLSELGVVLDREQRHRRSPAVTSGTSTPTPASAARTTPAATRSTTSRSRRRRPAATGSTSRPRATATSTERQRRRRAATAAPTPAASTGSSNIALSSGSLASPTPADRQRRRRPRRRSTRAAARRRSSACRTKTVRSRTPRGRSPGTARCARTRARRRSDRARASAAPPAATRASYAGSPSRTQATDGHFVHRHDDGLCGNGIGGRVGERAVRPVPPANGTAGSCCVDLHVQDVGYAVAARRAASAIRRSSARARAPRVRTDPRSRPRCRASAGARYDVAKAATASTTTAHRRFASARGAAVPARSDVARAATRPELRRIPWLEREAVPPTSAIAESRTGSLPWTASAGRVPRQRLP